MKRRSQPTSVQNSYYEVVVSEMALQILRKLTADGLQGPARKRILDYLELATPCPPPGRLPWAEVEREARRQGVSTAEIIWDRARGKEHG